MPQHVVPANAGTHTPCPIVWHQWQISSPTIDNGGFGSLRSQGRRKRMTKPMIPPLKPGAKLLKVDGPIIETARLILRPWRSDDIAANTAMLSDPGTARYITPDGIAITTENGGWRNAAIISGHWALHGFGMFAVEEKSRRRYIGRVGPWCPPGWPGFEVGWGIARECRGKGYAVEAARASIEWAFDSFEVD